MFIFEDIKILRSSDFVNGFIKFVEKELKALVHTLYKFYNSRFVHILCPQTHI